MPALIMLLLRREQEGRTPGPRTEGSWAPLIVGALVGGVVFVVMASFAQWKGWI